MARKVGGAKAHLEAAKRQGLTVAAYARQNGLSAQSLYSARCDSVRRQRRQSDDRTGSAFTAVEVLEAAGSTVQANFPNGVTLSFSGADVAGFLATLAALPCSG